MSDEKKPGSRALLTVLGVVRLDTKEESCPFAVALGNSGGSVEIFNIITDVDKARHHLAKTNTTGFIVGCVRDKCLHSLHYRVIKDGEFGFAEEIEDT